MLNDIRQTSKSGATYIMVAILVVVFAVYFGAPQGSCNGSGPTRVARVAGHDLFAEDVNIIQFRSFGGQRANDESELLRQQAASMRALVLIYLLADRAEAEGIRVSDKELTEYIKNPSANAEFLWAYGQNGKFDGPFYKNYVQYQLRVNLAKYEDYKHRELLALKYLTLAETQYNALEWELEEMNQLKNTKVDLEYLKFDPTKLAQSIVLSDEDIANFTATKMSDIEAYYTANKTKYEDPAQIRLRRIFILRPGESEGDDKVKAADAKWEQAKTRVKTEDFATVAGEMTEDYAKEKQGLMDWSTLENMDQNIAGAVKDAKVGDVKEVTTDFAYMLVKVEETKEAKVTPIADVTNEIAKTLLQGQRVNQEIQSMVAQVVEQAKTAESLEAAVDALRPVVAEGAEPVASVWDSVSVASTGLFTIEGEDYAAILGRSIPGLGRPWDSAPGIGPNPQLIVDAFKLTKDAAFNGKVYDVGPAKVVIRLKERQEATADTLKENRDMYAAQIREQKMRSALGPWQAIFFRPIDPFNQLITQYGPVLEGMLKEALDDKTVKLYEKNYVPAQMMRDAANPAVAEVEPSAT
ncbi:MAG: SurA N-terminal domain-containing protein [bacterium]